MRDRVGRFLRRVNDRYPRGLYRDLGFPLLDVVNRKLTLYWHYRGWIQALMRLDSKRKMPPFAAESYQAVWVLTVVVLLSLPPGRIVGAISLYRIYEIMIFSLHWIFVSRHQLHFYRRSLAGFMVNLIEIVVLFAVALRAFACIASDSAASAIYESARTLVTVGPSEKVATGPFCRSLIVWEHGVAYVLTVIIVANVAGGVRRSEVRKQHGDGSK